MIRGRKPKATALKVLEGNPGKRPIKFAEPKPKRGAPPCPPWLDDYARTEWERIVPALDRIGLLTEVDGFVLEAYCTCYGHWRRHEDFLARFKTSKVGHVFNAGKSEARPYLQALAQVGLAQCYLSAARSLAAELGLSPSMRTRILAPEVGGEQERQNDRLEDFFSHKRKA